MKQVTTRREAFKNNLSTAWDLIWGQCSLDMQNTLISDEEFDSALEEADCVWLLRKTRHNMLEYLQEKYVVHSSIEGEKALLNTRQGNLSLREYHEVFRETLEAVIYANGGDLAIPESVIEYARQLDEVISFEPEYDEPEFPEIPNFQSSATDTQKFAKDVENYFDPLKQHQEGQLAYEEQVKRVSRAYLRLMLINRFSVPY